MALPTFMNEMRTAHDESLINNFFIAHWLAANDVATLKYESLIAAHMEQNRLPINCAYICRKSAVLMQRAMSASLEIKLSKTIQDRNLPYGIVIDESTDIATRSSLILYIRYVHAEKFVPVTQFLKLLTIIDKDATTIKQTVKNYLTQMKFNLKLLTGFGSDGASVMTGPNAGVAVQLRLDEDFLSALIAAHCSGHKVPLTCLDAMNPRTGADIAAHFDSYKTFIIALRSIFKNSSQRCAELEKCQQELNIPKRRVLKYIPTRWMSLYSVSSRLVGNYKALWNCLTNLIKENKISDKKSKQNIALILANLQTFNVLSTCQFLTIVLKPLFIFCERMQSNSLTINDLFMDVNDVISQLQNFIAGGCRVGIIYEAKNGINESTQTYAFKHQESLEFKGEVEDIIKLENLFIQFSKNLLRAFEHRFPFPVLYQALALFDFNIWNKNCIIYPSDDQKRIEEKNMLKHNFGNNFISILAKHFHRNEVDVTNSGPTFVEQFIQIILMSNHEKK